MGLPEGPAGLLGGAVVGLGVGAAELGVQGLMNRGGTGGNSAPSPVAPGSISGFRERGRPIDQANVTAQQRGHIAGGSTAAFTGSTRTLNGENEGHQPRDRLVRSRITPAVPPAPAATVAPITTASASAPAPEGPTQSGQDVYAAIVQNMARSERERSPPRGDRRPLATQRAEAELTALSGDARERAVALAKRDKTVPKPPVTVAASSSSSKPPPPPGAGAIKKKVAMYDIAKTPRPQAATRPLVPQTQISGKKRKAEDEGGVRGRPAQPRPAHAVPRGTKRPGVPLSRPGARPAQPAGPPIETPKAKKVESPPVRANQKKASTWRQPRVNSRWSRVTVR